MNKVALLVLGSAVAIPVCVFLATAGFLRTADPIARTGRISEVRGLSDLAVGDTCEVDVLAEARADLNCRVTIRCGERTLFGGEMLGGYAACHVTDGRYDAASDPAPTARDGDPIVEVDVARRFARVADAKYDVQIALGE
jgi:hypothetical protein